MAAQPAFNDLVRTERERAGLSLRELAQRCGINPGSLSRIEAGQTTPRVGTAIQLAEGIAAARGNDPGLKDRLILRLVQGTGRVPAGEASPQTIRTRFRERLKGEGLDEARIEQTMQAVDLGTMLRVVRGEEPLEIRHASELSRPGHGINLDQQVVMLGDEPLTFPAGDRASIRIAGTLSAKQRHQVKLLSEMLRSVLQDDAERERRAP